MMLLVEVQSNHATERDFLEINAAVHQNNPYYIRPLNKEVKAVFDTTQNPSFAYGTCKRWILKDDNHHCIGRIAAFTNSKYKTKNTPFKVGCFGFFDCIDNQQAANLLFDAAAQWLHQQGVEAMDGPVNFGDRDKWWGLLLEGFDAEPVYGMSYNPPYYQQLFERYGLKNYYYQYFFGMDVDTPLPPKIAERYERFANKTGYSATHISKKQLPKYANDFATVYNAAWAQHGENKTITSEQVLKIFKEMKPIIDERTIWFAYYKEDPIAMFVNIPDINQYFRFFDGKLGIWQKLQLVWMKQKGMCKKLTGLAFGVIPKFQSLGIDSFIIGECSKAIQYKGWYNSYEMGWAGEWNPKMLNVYKNLGAYKTRTLATYRYIFDETKYPFERHPALDYKLPETNE